jgi:hypothetical protein
VWRVPPGGPHTSEAERHGGDRAHVLTFFLVFIATQVVLVDPAATAKALAVLADVNSRLPLPLTGLIAFARELGADDRRQVKNALRLTGFETYSPERIVGEVLALVTSVLGTDVGRAA